MYFYFLLVLLLPMAALRKRPAECERPVLDARSTTAVKGVLCLYVMLHNLGLDVPGHSPFKQLVCEYTGGIAVGVFFFLSAYGIIRSYRAKGNSYLVRLCLVHIPRLYLVSVGINLLTYLVFFRGTLETGDLLMQIFNLDVFNGFRRMNRHGWYITSIIALYLVFALVYFLCSFLKNRYRFIIAAVIVSAVTLGFWHGTLLAGKGGTYTREMLCFAVGCLYATFYDAINRFASRFFVPGLLISVLGFLIVFPIDEPLATYAAILCLVFVSQRYTYDSRITFFLGKICLGVYLFLHFSTLLFWPLRTQEYPWVLLNAVVILALSIALHALLHGGALLAERLRGRRRAA